MTNNSLIASVALFSELYDSEKDLYDVIAEFIKGAIQIEKLWTFSPTEITTLLKRVYGFDIPEAVTTTVLKNRLRNEGFLNYEVGIYTATDKLINTNKTIETEFYNNKNIYSEITNKLIEYVENHENRKLSIPEKNDYGNLLNTFLLGNHLSDENAKYISSFIISNQYDKGFVSDLNTVKEGLVLYSGIRYTSDLNQLGSWNSELTIFLDTEHLFNALGFNGVVYEEIFHDFFKLVNEINISNRNKTGKSKIHLKYFEENKKGVEDFFYAAEMTLKNRGSVDPSKTAMLSILNGCKSPSDIINKKTKFFSDLTVKGIKIEEPIDYYANVDLNIESEETVSELNKISKENKRYFNAEECLHFLKIFTKINVLRNGINNTGFDNVKYIFLTGNRAAMFYAFNTKVKFGEKDTIYATDIDFITNRFWFKLKKGFSNSDGLPKSFDVVTNAQIVISSLINRSVSKRYEELLVDLKTGNITKEQAIDLSYTLREKPSKPEDVTLDSIENNLQLIDDESFEKHLREKETLLRLVNEGNEAKQELKRRDKIDKLNEFEKQERQYTLRKAEFGQEKWNESILKFNSDFRYLLLIWTPELISVFFGFLVKVNKNLNEYLESIGNKQYIFWVILALFVSFSQLGKSYFFNKERAKNGWKWFCSFFSPSQRSKIKSIEMEKSSLEFGLSNPKPTIEI